MRTILAAAAATVAVIAAPATPGVATGAPSSSSGGASIEWSECGTTEKGECATIELPVDWSKPGGAAFGLAIGRLPALDPARRIGVLFANPGGPGASGIDRYITGRAIADDSALRQRFDIVSWDPRGVARSHPVRCSASLVGQTPATFPNSEAEYRSLLAFNRQLVDDCRQHTGPLFDHVDTVSTVRDLDAIRAALGEARLSFFGVSYGTQIGQQYAERFPSRMRAMVLDSNMDHSITSPYRYLQTTTDDLEGSFNAFGSWCRRTADCALSGRDVGAVWDDLFHRATAGDLVDPDTGELVDAEMLRVEVFLAMYRTTAWYPLGARLASLDGEGSSAAARPAPSGVGDDEIVEHAYPAIWCSDWGWKVPGGFAELDAYRVRLAGQFPHMELSPFWADVTSCLGWTGAVSNPQHKLAIRGVPPILMVKAREDVATPKAWNYSAAAQIPGSVMLEHDGVGHAQYRNSRCVRGHVEEYLVTLVTPPAGTHCPAELPEAPAGPGTLDDGRVFGRPAH